MPAACLTPSVPSACETLVCLPIGSSAVPSAKIRN